MKRSGRATWLLLLVPLIAVGASVAVLTQAEPPVRTFATVSVIPPEGSSTAATITQAVDGFRSTVTSDTVAQLAGQDANASITADDVTAERVGTSNLVELRIETEPGEDGEAATQALVSHANDALFSSSLTFSDARVETAEQRYQKALDERAQESARTGLLLPIEAYRAKAAEVTQLRVALATAAPEVNRATISTTLARAQKDLAKIGKSVNAFESLEESVVRSRTELGSAQQEVDNVTTRLAAATAPESITITESTTPSSRTTVARGVLTALVLGVALALGLVLLIGLFRDPDRSRPQRPAQDPTEPPAEPSGPTAARNAAPDSVDEPDAGGQRAGRKGRRGDREAALM
ncbi:MAG: hypothetical protein WBP61_10975 [Nocardioides sp.]